MTLQPQKKEGGSSKISVLEGKKAYNLSLVLGSLKLDPLEVRRALLHVDALCLTENLLNNLLVHLPTEDEARGLKAYEHDPRQLALPDYFFSVLTTIPRLDVRLQAIMYLKTFDQKVMSLTENVQLIQKTCDSIRGSKRLAKFSELVLLLGNYMNGGQRTSAQGFKVSSLNKLADLKSSDNQRTLLQFVVTLVDQKFPDVSELPKDLATCKEASRLSLDMMAGDLSLQKAGLRKIEAELELHGEGDNPEDHFIQVFSTFAVRAKAELEVLDSNLTKTRDLFVTTASFFGEDPASSGPEVFFGLLDTFRENFLRARKEVEETARREAAKAKTAAKLKAAEKDRRDRRTLTVTSSGDDGEEETGILDGLLKSLRKASGAPRRSLQVKTIVKREESTGSKKKSMRQAKKRNSIASPIEAIDREDVNEEDESGE